MRAHLPTPDEVQRNLESWFVYVCPHCGRQYRAPGAHHVAGDDSATSCSHRHDGERGVSQPRLIRVRVAPAEEFVPIEVPHDVPPMMAESCETVEEPS